MQGAMQLRWSLCPWLLPEVLLNPACDQTRFECNVNRVMNVRKADGTTVTVNAQPYVVLAYDVPAPRKARR